MNDPFDFNSAAQAEATGSGNFLSLLPVIAWQRKWWILIPTAIGAIAAVAAVYLIEPVYRANAIMLVESPQLPNEVLNLSGTEVVDRRIARIKQQVTARPDLISLVEQHGLYPEDRRSGSLSGAVTTMRDAILLEPNQVGEPRSGQNTIAFELSFSYHQPVQAQAVTQDLMDRILQLDASGNVEQATNTVQFLQDQATGLETQIAQLQNEIARITAANGSALTGATIIGGASGSYDVQIASLQRDNQQLTSQRTLALSSNERDPVVLAAEQQLAAARVIYAESHPDVVVARQRLVEAQELAKNNTARLPVESIDDQIAFNNAQIAALRAARAQEGAQINSRLASQARAPLVQQQIGELQQRLATVNQQYEQVQSRLMTARAGVRAEDEQMGERLAVVEPPIVPDEPIWPDRMLLFLGGLGGGLGLGLLLAFGIELILQPIRDPSALRNIAGTNPLGAIPIIELKRTPSSRRRRFWPFGRRQAI